MSKANLLAQDLERASRTDLITTSLGSERSNVSGTASAEEAFQIECTLLVRVGRIHTPAVVLDLSMGPLQFHDHLRRFLAVARCPAVVLGEGIGKTNAENTAETETGN